MSMDERQLHVVNPSPEMLVIMEREMALRERAHETYEREVEQAHKFNAEARLLNQKKDDEWREHVAQWTAAQQREERLLTQIRDLLELRR